MRDLSKELFGEKATQALFEELSCDYFGDLDFELDEPPPEPITYERLPTPQAQAPIPQHLPPSKS
jgi:hypothetical protein